jgi:hypothetical protein
VASDILQDVKSFLDDLTHELTGLNVKTAAVTNAPDDQGARDALAAVPGALIERAQGLSSRIEQQENPDEDADGTRPVAKSAAKAKASAAKHAEFLIATARAAYVVGQIALDEFERKVDAALAADGARMPWGDALGVADVLDGSRTDAPTSGYYVPPVWLTDEFDGARPPRRGRRRPPRSPEAEARCASRT